MTCTGLCIERCHVPCNLCLMQMFQSVAVITPAFVPALLTIRSLRSLVSTAGFPLVARKYLALKEFCRRSANSRVHFNFWVNILASASVVGASATCPKSSTLTCMKTTATITDISIRFSSTSTLTLALALTDTITVAVTSTIMIMMLLILLIIMLMMRRRRRMRMTTTTSLR